MFTAFIDDSGTDPKQKVANATALLVPGCKIIRFQSEWNSFVAKWQISDFHASECAAANPKSQFAGWDQIKIRAIFRRVRQIIRKYGVKAYSLSVRKADYGILIPAENRPIFGNHEYTYATQNLLAILDDWASRSDFQYPLEFVFDWMDKTQKSEKQEIEAVLARSEAARPGRFAGRYSFRNRKEAPGLQCVDLIAWTCYRFSLTVYGGPQMTSLQSQCWLDFNKWGDGNWLTSVGQTQKQISNAVSSLQRVDDKNPLRLEAKILS